MKTDEQTTTPDILDPNPVLPPPLVVGELHQVGGLLPRLLPRLSVDERAALRPLAFALLKAAEVTGQSAQRVGTMQPPGFYQACLTASVNALSAGASALCLLAASVGLALTTDGDEPTKEA